MTMRKSRTADQDRELQRIREKTARQLRYEAEEKQYHAILQQWVTEVYQKMCRDSQEWYAYHLPSTATEYGRLGVFGAEEETKTQSFRVYAERHEGAGTWRLISPNPVPRGLNAAGLYLWIKRHADHLAMYPFARTKVSRG